MSEIIFVVENSDEGGYTAKSLGYSIYTEAETLDELKENVKDAIKCHFDEKEIPRIVRLHIVLDSGKFYIRQPSCEGLFSCVLFAFLELTVLSSLFRDRINCF